jgi:hypothetical protein
MQARGSTALLTEALSLLSAALKLLDQAGALGDIGAHVNQAQERLRETISLVGLPEETAVLGPRPDARGPTDD